MALLRLFDPVNQFQTKSGALNTSGLLRVYLNGTDDYAAVHDDSGSHEYVSSRGRELSSRLALRMVNLEPTFIS